MKPWQPLCLLLSLLGSTSCASATRIKVEAAETTNAGRSFYMLIRQVEQEEVLAASYEEAAQRVFTREAAPEGELRKVIIPGTPLTVDVDAQSKRDIVLYFFFTEPGDRWWLSIARDRLPAEIVIDLGINEVERVGVRGR
ncbi:MAG: hypothetical protein AAFU79_01855 [Myxococcota bacterium]